MVMVLCAHYGRADSDYLIMNFDVSQFSSFPEEQEILFFGGDTKLRIKGIMKVNDGKWERYDKYMEPINALSHLIHGLPLKGQRILTSQNKRKKRQALLMDLLKDILQSANKVESLDFDAISEVTGVDDSILRDGLEEYERDRDQLYSDLIDVVYGDDNDKMEIWGKLKMDDGVKMRFFRDLLHLYLDCTQLSARNLVKICDKINHRLFLKIDLQQMDQRMNSMDLDGAFWSGQNFLDRTVFKNLIGNSQNTQSGVETLYEAILEWKYVEGNRSSVEYDDEKRQETNDKEVCAVTS